MSPNPSLRTGDPCWLDLATSNIDQAVAFYGGLFGWTAESAGSEYGGYVTFHKDGRAVAGAMPKEADAGYPDVWTTYLYAHDIAAVAAATPANGGTVELEPFPVGPLGIMAVLNDAGHAHVGVWQPGEHRGMETHGEPGTPVYFELHTRDYDASVDFYRNVFGWNAVVAADLPGFRYTTLDAAPDYKAGIMDATAFLPDGVPAHWSVYFLVEDADSTLAKIVDLGGSIVMDAQDTPYGRLAAVADTTGAMFKIKTAG